MKVLYVFNSSLDRPSFMTYGYSYFMKSFSKKYDAYSIEKKTVFTRMRFRKMPDYYKAISYINTSNPDIVYITSDGPAIEILKLRSNIHVEVKIVVNAVGITTSHLYGKEVFLQKSDAIICFSHKIKNKLETTKTKFIKYGTDFDYFKYKSDKKGYVVCIGNDLHRDWKLLDKIANFLPEIDFFIIGRDVNKLHLSSSNIISLGNTDFLETRDVLMSASLCLVLTKNNDAFSGETTILNSLACGTNVLFPNDDNLIDHGELQRYTYRRNIDNATLADRVKKEINNTVSIGDYEKLKKIYHYDVFCKRLDGFFSTLESDISE